MDLGPLLNWTLEDYRRVCAALMDVNHFEAIAVDGKHLVIYDGNRFERDTA